MRFDSVLSAISDEKLRARCQKTWSNWRAMWLFKLPVNYVASDGHSGNLTTRNLLATPSWIFNLNICLQIAPTRPDFSENRILMPTDCLCSWYRRTEIKYCLFDSCTGQTIRLYTKFSEDGTWVWFAPARKSRKANTLDQDCDEQFRDRIRWNAENNTPVGNQGTKYYYTSQFQGLLTRSWVHSLILRYPEEIIQIKTVPQEEQPFLMTDRFLVHYCLWSIWLYQMAKSNFFLRVDVINNHWLQSIHIQYPFDHHCRLA